MAVLSEKTNKILQDIAENNDVLSQNSELAKNTELVKYVKDLLNRWAEKNKINGWTKLDGEKFDGQMEKALKQFSKAEKIDIASEKLGFRALGRLLVSVNENERIAGISTLTSAKYGEEILSTKSLNKDRTRFGADLAEAAMNAWVREVTPEKVEQIVKNSKEKINLTLEDLKKGLNSTNKQYDEKFPEFVKAFQTWYNVPPAKGTPPLVVDGIVGGHTTAAAKKYIEQVLKEPAKVAVAPPAPGERPAAPPQNNAGIPGVPPVSAPPAPPKVEAHLPPPAVAQPPAPPAPATPSPVPIDALPVKLTPEHLASIKKNPELLAALSKVKEMGVTVEEGAEKSTTLKILKGGKLVDQLSIGMLDSEAKWQNELKGKLEEIIDPSKRAVYIADKTNSGIDFSTIIKTGNAGPLGWFDSLKEKGISITLMDKDKGIFEFKKGNQMGLSNPLGPVNANNYSEWGSKLVEIIVNIQRPQAAQNQSPIPEGTQRPDLISQKLAKDWSDTHLKVSQLSKSGADGGLIDGSKYVSPDGAKVMATFAAQSGEGLTFTDNGVKSPSRFQIKDQSSGVTWNVSSPPSYIDQYGPDGPKFKTDHVVLSKVGTDGKIQIEVPSRQIFVSGNIDFRSLKETLSLAESNRRSEMADPAKVSSYDMSSKPIGYIGLVDPNKKDPVLNGIKEDLKFAPNLFNSLLGKDEKPRYNMVTMNGSESIDVTSDPGAILRKQISAMKEKGINEFRINLAGHGNDEGVHFGNGLILSPAELAKIFKENPGSKFIVDTVACQGGGLANMIEQFKDVGGEPGRVQIRLQSKESAFNQEGRLKNVEGELGAPKTFSTYYNVFYFEALREGLTDGQAHLQADLRAKKLVPCDAEVWMSSSQGGTATKGIRIPTE